MPEVTAMNHQVNQRGFKFAGLEKYFQRLASRIIAPGAQSKQLDD
jgi:hypothetical protein